MEDWHATRGAAAVPLFLQHQEEYVQQQKQAVRAQEYEEARALYEYAHDYFSRRRAAAEEALRRLLQQIAEAAAQVDAGAWCYRVCSSSCSSSSS